MTVITLVAPCCSSAESKREYPGRGQMVVAATRRSKSREDSGFAC